MGFSSACSKALPPDQVGVFVAFEVAEPHDHRVRVIGRGDLGDPEARASTKYSRRVRIACGCGSGSAAASPGSVTRSGWTSAMGWIRMRLLMMNSIRASPTPAAGSRHHWKAAAGLAMLTMTCGRRLQAAPEVDLFGFERQGSFVDVPLIALGAGDGDASRRLVHRFGGVAGADDGGHPQFPADDGRVARGAAVVGDDSGCPLHDGNPVRIGHLGDQDRAVTKPVDLRRVADDAGRTVRNRVADGRSGSKKRTASGETMRGEDGSCCGLPGPSPAGPGP